MTESSLTLTEIVDIDTGEITVEGRASPDEFWEPFAASVGFPDLSGGERVTPLHFIAGGALALVVVVIICGGTWLWGSPWCW